MADFIPSDPHLIDAVKNPRPVHTNDPASVEAMQAQAAAMKVQADAAARFADIAEAFIAPTSSEAAGCDARLRIMCAVLANPVHFDVDSALVKADKAYAHYLAASAPAPAPASPNQG